MRITLGCLLVACTVFFSACTPKTPKVVSKTPEELDALARSFVLFMASGEHGEASKIFSKQMAGAIPASKLAELWSGLLARGGQWKQIAKTRFAEESGYRVVYVTAAFEKGTIDIKVVFDHEAKVAGLWLGAFQPLPESSQYAAPPYVQEDSFAEQEVTVGQGRWALPGTLTMPKGKGPFPAVVLVHGSGPNDRDETMGPNKPFKDLAWGLASRGIAVLRYEKRTKHYAAEMQNSVSNLTVKEETIDDAVAGVALLKGTPGVDPDRVFVVGHSLGATLAPRIAQQCMASPSTRIAGIVMLAPASRSILDLIVEQVEYIAQLDGTIDETESRQIQAIKADVEKIRSGKLREGELALNAPKSYWDDLAAHNVVEIARGLGLPMLILQGERDYQVTMADLQGWKDALLESTGAKRTNVTVKSYRYLNHLFMSGTGKSSPDEYLVPGHVSEDVIVDISNWVKSVAAAK